MVESMFDHGGRHGRVEIHAGVGRRRRWTAAQKALVVAESFAAGAVASDVARRHEISPQHLFQWRRAARRGGLVLPMNEDVGFAPVVLEQPDGPPDGSAGVEVEVGGAILRVGPRSDLRLVVALVHALQNAK